MRTLFAFCLLTISVALQAQSNYYSIMLGAYSAAHLTHFAAARQVGFVYSIPVEGGFQVYVGGFESDSAVSGALTKVQALGYTEARKITRQVDGNKKKSYIQLASQHYLNPIKWSRFNGLENLQVIVQGDLVRIVMGPYENGMAAQVDLANAQAIDFPDAFVKLQNPVYMHRLSVFETQPIVAKPTPAKAVPMMAAPPTEISIIEPPKTADVIADKGNNRDDAASYLSNAVAAVGQIRYENAKISYRQLNNYVRLCPDNQMQDVAIYLMAAKDATTEALPPDEDGSNVISKELLDLTDPLSASEVTEARAWHDKLTASLKADNNNLLQLAYAGAWLRLQQHYIANGLAQKDATNVALLVLKLSSEEYLKHLTR